MRVGAPGLGREEQGPLRHEGDGAGRDGLAGEDGRLHHFADRAAGRADAEGLVEGGAEERAAVHEVAADFVFGVATAGVGFGELGEDLGADVRGEGRGVEDVGEDPVGVEEEVAVDAAEGERARARAVETLVGDLRGEDDHEHARRVVLTEAGVLHLRLQFVDKGGSATPLVFRDVHPFPNEHDHLLSRHRRGRG